MDSDPALNRNLTVALVVAAYAGSVHPLTSHLMTRRFIPWALGHCDTRALSRLQLFLYVHCDMDGSNTSLVPARGHPDLPQKDHYSGVAWRPAPCAAHPQTTAAMQECGRRRWLKCSLEFLPNIGREAHLYLRHIVNVHGKLTPPARPLPSVHAAIPGLNPRAARKDRSLPSPDASTAYTLAYNVMH